MDLTSPAQLQDLLQEHNLYPSKRLGQNFLVDRNVLNKILDALDLRPGDPVLEIGPGVGTLTKAVAEQGAHVVAVEIDHRLIPILAKTLHSHASARVFSTDFLDLDLPSFLREHFGNTQVKIVGNVPYYITTPIIAKLIGARTGIERIVLMVQKEVAQRLQAGPGTREYGSMSVFVQFYCRVEIAAQVSRNVFLPPPDVSSALVRLTPRSAPPVEVPSDALFLNVVHGAFGQRRKTLLNSLSAHAALGLSKEQTALVLSEAGIDPARRAETLSLDEFARIARVAAALR